MHVVVTHSTLMHVDSPTPKEGSVHMLATPSTNGASDHARSTASASSMSSWVDNLAALGLQLPSTVTPIGVYVPAVRAA